LVIIGGVPSILIGSSGILVATNQAANVKVGQSIKEDELASLNDDLKEIKEEFSNIKEEIKTIPINSQIAGIDDSINIASGIKDEMTFSDAFAMARAEVGPGGTFIWHGNLYGTYNESEWHNLSDEERDAYAQNIWEEYCPQVNSHIESPVNNISSSYDNESQIDDSEIKVLGHDIVPIEDDRLINVTAVEVDGHYGEVYDFNNDGKVDAAMIDSNSDGSPDVALVDINCDGKIDSDEVFPVNDDIHQSVNDSNTEDAIYEDMPDYTNDADTGNFI
jgi:hypothetical protein